MRKQFVLYALFVFLCSGMLYGQENVESFLINLKDAGAKDYVKLMYEGSQETKLFAALKLGELKSSEDEVIDALVYGLGQGTFYVVRQYGKVINDYWDVRAASAKAIGEIGSPKPLNDLYIALRYDPDTFVKTSIVYAIGKIGQKESVPYLTRIILTSTTRGPDDQLVLASVDALGEIGDSAGFMPLVEVIRGNYKRSIKLSAMEAIKKINW